MEQGRSTSLRLTDKSSKLVPRDISESLGKVPPQAVDLEEVVLGAMLLQREAQVMGLEALQADDFYNEQHKYIFAAIAQLAEAGNPIDMRTVKDQLQRTGRLEVIGGTYYIADLTSKVSSAANLKYHAHIIIEKRMLRDMIQMASEIHHQAYEDTTDVFQLLELVKKFPLQIADSIRSTKEKSIKDEINALAKRIGERKDSQSEVTGIATGFTKVDRITAGWQRTDLIIIAARPSMGKTAFALNCLRNAAVLFKIPVAIFSLEMSAAQLTERMVSIDTEIELRVIKNKSFGDADWAQFHSKISPLHNAPIFIDDAATLTITEFRIRARRLVEVHKVELIVVDYLQLMSAKNNNREQEIGMISRGLKATAKELNIPILALSQLSRDVDKRPLPRIPVLGDLRESGSIEQDADVVGFLWRAAYYNVSGDERGTFVDGLTKMIIAKHRNGDLGEPPIGFRGKTSTFYNIDSAYVDNSATAAALQPTQPDNWIEEKKNVDDLPF